jgi:small-conductance mechanosensitive channel
MFKIALGNFKKFVNHLNKYTNRQLSYVNDKTDDKSNRKNLNSDSLDILKNLNNFNKPQFFHYKPTKKHIQRGINYQKEDEEAFRLKQEKNKLLENGTKVMEKQDKAEKVEIVSDDNNFKSTNLFNFRPH